MIITDDKKIHIKSHLKLHKIKYFELFVTLKKILTHRLNTKTNKNLKRFTLL